MKKERIWVLNFLFLWQGAFVSEVGNSIYTIALAFWLLRKTGSTAVMGILTSVAMLVHSIFCLFSGVIIDKINKRNVLVFTDFFRGLLCTILGIAVLWKVCEFWVIIITGILGGICSAFFFPASQSLVPEIVPAKKLMKANAFMIMIVLGTPVIGNGAGGFLFETFGAALLFIANGISFFISGFSELFIKVPGRRMSKKKIELIKDIKEGFTYLRNRKGLFFFLLFSMGSNLFAFTGLFLILPFFEEISHLGPVSYGIAMASMAAGGFTGMLLSTLFTIPPHQRFPIYTISLIGMTLLPVFIPYWPMMPVLCLLGFFAGFMRAYVFLIFNVVIQSNVEKNKMGRIFGLVGIMMHTITPLGMILGGSLAEFFPLDFLITGSFLLSGLIILPVLFYQPCITMFEKEPRDDIQDDIARQTI